MLSGARETRGDAAEILYGQIQAQQVLEAAREQSIGTVGRCDVLARGELGLEVRLGQVEQPEQHLALTRDAVPLAARDLPLRAGGRVAVAELEQFFRALQRFIRG